MLSKPIPEAAMPVAEILRAEVPRPEGLPRGCIDIEGNMRLRWTKGRNEKMAPCPMGLHPEALSNAPVFPNRFLSKDPSRISEEAVYAFWYWWDSLAEADAGAACDAIWGEGR